MLYPDSSGRQIGELLWTHGSRTLFGSQHRFESIYLITTDGSVAKNVLRLAEGRGGICYGGSLFLQLM